MTEQSSRSARVFRLVILALLVVEVTAAGVALLLVRRGRAPFLGPTAGRYVAFVWVAVTILAAAGAYLLAIRTTSRGLPVVLGRAIAAAGLAELAAFAGIAAFYFVHVWPMLMVAALAALLAPAIAFPLAQSAGDDAAVAEAAPAAGGASALPR